MGAEPITIISEAIESRALIVVAITLESMALKPQVCCLLLLVSLMIAGQSSASIEALSLEDIAVIQELYYLWSSRSESIWPGASETQAPILYIKSDNEYAIGFPNSPKGFVPVTAAKQELQQSIQIRHRTFATNLSASFPVEGTPAVVMASPELLKQSPENWVITASHEVFHVFQAANGSYAKVSSLSIRPTSNASWQLTFPFPYGNSDVMRLIHLQGYPLWLAATSSNDTEARYAVGTAVDAAMVYRTFLNRLTKPEDYLYSELQEWQEGVAAYTEYRFAEAAGRSDYTPTPAFRALPGFSGYDRLWREAYQNRPYLVKHAGRAAQSRDAFYHLGMGKAFALDKVDPSWKKRYFASGVWLDDLLKASTEDKR